MRGPLSSPRIGWESRPRATVPERDELLRAASRRDELREACEVFLQVARAIRSSTSLPLPSNTLWRATLANDRRSRRRCRAFSAPAAMPFATSSVPNPPGDAPMTPTGRPPKTRAISVSGRDNQSIAFLNTPGIELLYSGVTSNKPSVRDDALLEPDDGLGQSLRSLDVAVVERNAFDAADLERRRRPASRPRRRAAARC